VPGDDGDAHRLRLALAQLAEHDPLINVRQDDARREISVSLYGDVQKEVIQATLADEFGIEATFRDVTPIYVERPAVTGEAVEVLHAETNPFYATIGLRVDPADHGSGVGFELDVDPRTVPLYLYKTLDSFREHMDRYVRDPLREGLFGWEVTDCRVTMTGAPTASPTGLRRDADRSAPPPTSGSSRPSSSCRRSSARGRSSASRWSQRRSRFPRARSVWS
jgi:ribosomal protection tetracycline resistance protein